MFFSHFAKVYKFSDFLFASLTEEALLKWDLLLTLLHSERPKLYTILAFLSALGLKEKICTQCS